MQKNDSIYRGVKYGFLAVLTFSILFLTSRHSYLFFYVLAESFSAAVAFAIFMIAWNARHYLDNNYLFIIGIAYLFIGGFDLLHTMAYKGMNIFNPGGADLSTQLWISARYIQALSFVIAPLFVGRRLCFTSLISAYLIVGVFCLFAVFYWDIFPVCFIEDMGITPFKTYSEYIICILLALSLYLLHKKRQAFDPTVYRLIMASIVITIISELSFTLYVSVYGPANLIGHFMKILAFYLIYRALIVKSLLKPYDVLFRDLKKSEQALRESEAFSSNLVRSSLNGLYVYDMKRSAIIYINPQYTRITGHTLQGFREKPYHTISDLIHPDDQNRLFDHFNDLTHAADEDIFEIEYRFKTADDRWIWCFSRDSVFRRDDDGSVAQIIGTFLDMTARRLAEQERERLYSENLEQRRFLEKLMAALPAGIAVIGESDGRFKFVNPYYQSQIGRHDMPIIGKGIQEVFPATALNKIMDAMATVSRTGKSATMNEFNLVNESGDEMRYWNMDCIPIALQSDIKNILVIAVDVTEQVNARKHAEFIAARDRAIFSSMNDGMILADKNGRILDMNPAALALHGETQQLTAKKSLHEYAKIFESHTMDGTPLPLKQWPLSRVLNRETFTNYEVRMHKKDTGKRWIGSYNGTAVYDNQGKFVAALLTIRDITIQKEAEIALKQSHDLLETRVQERTAQLTDANQALQGEIAEREQAEVALRENEQLLKAVLDNLPVGVWVMDATGQITMGNPAGKSIWGGTETFWMDHYGQHMGWWPETGEMLQPEEWAAARAIGKGKIILNEKVEIECFDGTHKIILNSALPIKDADGMIMGGIILHQDITEQHRAEEERTLYTQKLEWSNRELQDFAFVASHDLQEPLRKIQTFGDLLERDFFSALASKGTDYIERMQHAAGRMQTLIRDLLTYSRVTTQARPFSWVNLGDIVNDIILDLEVRIKETKAHLEVSPLYTIMADPHQMRQLLQNLMGNALKFHGEATPHLKIQGHLLSQKRKKSKDAFYEITVQDNGIGFDEKYLDRIFAPFQRLHSRADYEGTGMGLAICRKIAERHNGTITAKSTPGKGSTFIVILPLTQTPAEPRPPLT